MCSAGYEWTGKQKELVHIWSAGGSVQIQGKMYLSLNKRYASFSEKEMSPSQQALDGKRARQTHFTDSDASFRYGCPLRMEVIDWAAPSQMVGIHFTTIHGRSKIEYRINIENKTESEIVIPPRITRKRRDGAMPPSKDHLRQFGGEIAKWSQVRSQIAGTAQNEGPAHPDGCVASKGHLRGSKGHQTAGGGEHRRTRRKPDKKRRNLKVKRKSTGNTQVWSKWRGRAEISACE